ncbi:MAG: THUMP domain-containing protein [Thermoprotei archaeon]
MQGILVSTYRGREDDCASELWVLLREIGEPNPDIQRLPLPGLVIAYTENDPIILVEKIRSYAGEHPWDFRYVLKIVPLEIVIESSLEKLEEAVKKLAEKIEPEKTFRVTVNKRSSPLSMHEIIDVAAQQVKNRKVNLETPDYIINIEVVGSMMGISVIIPKHIVSIQKIKDEYLKNITSKG